MTLRRLHLLMTRRAEAERLADYRIGVLATLVARFAGAKNAKPSDFFPSLAERQPARAMGAASDDPMLAKLENFKAYLMRHNLLVQRGDGDHEP